LPTLFDNKLIIISLSKLYLKFASSNRQLRLAFSIFNP
jgi:hypothetical protein